MTIPEEPGLPPEAPVQRLSPRIVSVWRLGTLLGTLLLAVPAVVAGVLLERPFLFVAPVVLVGGFLAWYWPPRRYAHWEWRVGETDVRTRHGVAWRHESVVLHARIQHVDTRQGPVERAFGLASVVIYTAGSVGAMIGIPGLPAADAEALRDRLVALSGAEDAV